MGVLSIAVPIRADLSIPASEIGEIAAAAAVQRAGRACEVTYAGTIDGGPGYVTHAFSVALK